MNAESIKKLTPQEYAVIVNKATERPFTGKYCDSFDDGVYTCKVCDSALFESSDKFKSGCGWPAFDDAIIGAVKSTPDADGMRTEITCKRCGAHLGHIFKGEKLTNKDTRYCVNSLSLNFVPTKNIGIAVVAGGCFWGVEALMQKQVGVLSCLVGYTGGKTENPTYRQVCEKNTGHYEAVEIVFDKTKISYAEVLKLFFEIHDFTDHGGQGPDRGQQYMSAIFYADDSQKKEAKEIILSLKKRGFDVATQILPLKKFYPAEEYHQRYYEKNGKKPYCHIRKKIFAQ